MNKLEVISNLISLLNSISYEATILSLSRDCNIPIEYCRNCILQILENTILSKCLDSNYYNPDDPEESIYLVYLDNPSIFSKRLLAGDYDEIIWTINLKVIDSEEDQILSLTPLQFSAVSNIGETDNFFKHNALYEKKENIAKVSKSVRENQDKIQTAIDNHYNVSFNYRDKDKVQSTIIGLPLQIFTNVTDNWIYVTVADNQSYRHYRMDRIINSVKLIIDGKNEATVSINPKEKYKWGSYFNENLEPVHVKLLISDTTANIIRKIKSDTHNRTTGSLYIKNGLYYYEDDIIGEGEFKRWIRGFGSSIQIIEPANYRDDMINSAKTALSYYERADEWKDL